MGKFKAEYMPRRSKARNAAKKRVHHEANAHSRASLHQKKANSGNKQTDHKVRNLIQLDIDAISQVGASSL